MACIRVALPVLPALLRRMGRGFHSGLHRSHEAHWRDAKAGWSTAPESPLGSFRGNPVARLEHSGLTPWQLGKPSRRDCGIPVSSTARQER